MGIDNLEHGIVVDTEFFPGKQPGVCPPVQEAEEYLAKSVEIDSPRVQAMIHTLVEHHVAVTSTLAVFEISVPNRPPLKNMARAQRLLAPQAWSTYLRIRGLNAEENGSRRAVLLGKEMQFEQAFARAGGLLLAGCDPTSFGGVLPGLGDQRNLELLVEAGFTPEEAIHIATGNGAIFLGEDAIGTVAAGKAADLLVIAGNPARKIADVENIETVFKDGLGYDPEKLLQSVQGIVGLR